MVDRVKLIAELRRDEGEKLYAYQDSLGFWTIGVGRLIDRRGGGITKGESELLLHNDIDKVQDGLLHSLPWIDQLDDNRQRVLYNMAFNLGVAGLLKWTNTLEAVRTGDYGKAADLMAKSKWATQVGERAVRLIKLMRGA